MADLSSQIKVDDKHPFALGEKADMIHAHWCGGGKENATRFIVLKVLRGSNSATAITKLRGDLQDKAAIWAKLKHPNLVKVYGVYLGYGRMPALVVEYCTKGNVLQYVNSSSLSSQTKLDLARGIAEGLKYLHTSKVVHGDLRSANVLVKDDGQPALSDFGLTFIMDCYEFTTTKVAGNARWTAPEILNPPAEKLEASSEDLITMECDVFAFSMVVVEIFTGQVPYANKKDTAALFAIIDGQRPELPSEIINAVPLKEVCTKCWDKDPSMRLNANQICQVLSQTNNSGNVGLRGVYGWLVSWFR